MLGNVSLFVKPLSGVSPLSLVSQCCGFLSYVDVTLNDQTPSAVAACAQTMPQLATLTIRRVNPLPVFQGLVHRDSSLHSVEVWRPQWVCAALAWLYRGLITDYMVPEVGSWQ